MVAIPKGPSKENGVGRLGVLCATYLTACSNVVAQICTCTCHHTIDYGDIVPKKRVACTVGRCCWQAGLQGQGRERMRGQKGAVCGIGRVSGESGVART